MLWRPHWRHGKQRTAMLARCKGCPKEVDSSRWTQSHSGCKGCASTPDSGKFADKLNLKKVQAEHNHTQAEDTECHWSIVTQSCTWGMICSVDVEAARANSALCWARLTRSATGPVFGHDRTFHTVTFMVAHRPNHRRGRITKIASASCWTIRLVQYIFFEIARRTRLAKEVRGFQIISASARTRVVIIFWLVFRAPISNNWVRNRPNQHWFQAFLNVYTAHNEKRCCHQRFPQEHCLE